MDKIICKVCNAEFKDEGCLHKHLKAHKITMGYYYQTHYPRMDKYDGEFIRFKNKDYYFNTDFNTRENLKNWLESVPLETSKKYVESLFIARLNRKQLKLSPTQVELRSLMVPGMGYIQASYGDYYEFCERLGFKRRFVKYVFDRPLVDISKQKIIVDTREQIPLSFHIKTVSEALKFGDYKLVNTKKVKSDLVIERKSMNDLYGTMTHGYERFCRELDRAKEAGAYLVIVVEDAFKSVYTYPLQPHLINKIRVSPEFVLHKIREIIENYEPVQFLFVNDRKEASRVIEKLLASDGQYQEVDLQFAYDIKNL